MFSTFPRKISCWVCRAGASRRWFNSCLAVSQLTRPWLPPSGSALQLPLDPPGLASFSTSVWVARLYNVSNSHRPVAGILVNLRIWSLVIIAYYNFLWIEKVTEIQRPGTSNNMRPLCPPPHPYFSPICIYPLIVTFFYWQNVIF